jgi:hypothetical protein
LLVLANLDEDFVAARLENAPDSTGEVIEKGHLGREGLCHVWKGDAGQIEVTFFNNRVHAVEFSVPPPVRRPSFLERLRGWVGW